jgi:signal transduction histidine kinase
MRLSLQSSVGIRVVGEAGDGREAVEMAGELKPDVVLLDLAMPIMDGLEALPLIREAAPDAKVIVLSGFDDKRMRESALRLGAVAYVEKGTPTSDLVSIIKKHTLGVTAEDESAPAALPDDPFATRATSGLDVDHLVHELRTPLTVIQGLAATLSQRGDALPSATAAELLQALYRNSKQMASLLDAVASARDLDTGMTLYVEPIEVAGFVAEVLNDLSSLLDGRTISVDTTGVPDGTTVLLDPLRIRQVITNLVTNAVRFSPDGAPIEVAGRLQDGQLVVSCRDHGPGIPDERRAELFREHSRLGADGPGMGLGLFISRGIARAHGGDLRQEPAEGGGSNFLLTLPAAASVAAQ